MAERIAEQVPESQEIFDARTDLQVAKSRDGRPPKVTPEEAEYLLARGPYYARMMAARRALWLAQTYDDATTLVDLEYLDSLYDRADKLEDDLNKYDIDNEPPEPEIESVITDEIEPAQIVQKKTEVLPEVLPEVLADVLSEQRVVEARQDIEEVFKTDESKTATKPKAQTHARTQNPVAEQRRPLATREVEGRDGVNLYLEEIARTPLLNAEIEVELSKTIEAGLFAEKILNGEKSKKVRASREELEWIVEEGEQAQKRFIEANLRLVVSIARKYGRSQMPMLDLIQEGNTGLMRAVEKFDYTKGYKFSTYATWWVRQAITRGIAQQARIVRLPVHVVEELNQVGSARRELERTLGREVEPEDIAAELGMDIDRVLDLIEWGREHTSLDAPIDDDGETSLGDLIARETAPGPDATVLDSESRDRLNSLVAMLDERSADIVRSRYGLTDGRQHKLADIGARHGISAERVRQLEREAITKLRRIGDRDLATS